MNHSRRFICLPPAGAYCDIYPASFGATVSVGGSEWQAELMAFQPLDACNLPSSELMTAMVGRVALIMRGSCEFGTKALMAQQAGAVAAVIYNNYGGLFWMSAGTNGSKVRAYCST